MNYTAIQQLVDRKYRELGDMIEFSIVIDEYRNPVSGYNEGTIIKVYIPGIVENVSDFLINDNTGLKTGDKRIRIPTLYGIPRVNSEIKSGNQLYRVLSVKQYSPGGVALYYEVLARAYALVEDLDTLIRSLGELDLGSIVIDPNRQDSIPWMVIDHTHYKPTLTTLMSVDCIIDNQPFIGQARGWSVSPWSQTYIRNYLLNTFKKTLSAKLIKNLQTFTVNTEYENSVETICIASLAELGITGLSLSGSYGTIFSYFDVENTAMDAQRIAAFEGNNISYWTREAWGIDTDGTYATLNPNYGHGLRPIINLLSGVNCAYNSAGEFELQLT